MDQQTATNATRRSRRKGCKLTVGFDGKYVMRAPDRGVELRKQAVASLKKTGKGNELVRQQR